LAGGQDDLIISPLTRLRLASQPEQDEVKAARHSIGVAAPLSVLIP